MSEHVYKVVELVRSSTSSIEDAIQTAIKAGRPDFAQPALV
jgi:flavin-binding protein dodecin